jgi:sugar phosphate isomerase/epimerase
VPTRRQFLNTALVASAGLSVVGSTASAIEPIRRVGTSLLKLSLAGYSFRKYLDLKAKPKPAWTLPDFIDEAAMMGLPAVELTAYYFPETSPDYLATIKRHCTRLGLDVSGTAVGNNFCHTDPAKLKEQKKYVTDWVEHTARLGGKTVRIFAGNLERGDTEAKARVRVVEAIQEVCDVAAKNGVYLALENHGGVTATIDQMLGLVHEVRHEAFGVNFDTGNFRSADPYADLERLAPYAVVCQIKSEIHRTEQKAEEADLKRLTGILRTAGFRGYLAIEYEAPEDPKTAVPRLVKALTPLMG